MDYKESSIPLVSIGVPVYNGEKYLEECLDSVLAQTYTNWECVISVNLSVDRSLEIAKDYARKDSRFKVYEVKEFCGLVENWNNAFVHTNHDAKYCRILQADDLLFPDSIELNVKYLEQYPNAGIVSSYRIAGNYVDCWGISYSEGFCFDGKDMLLRHLTQKAEITGSITQLFFRFDTIRKIDNYPYIFDNNEYHIDARLAYEMFFISDVVFTHKILSYSRRHIHAETSTTVFKFNTLIHGKESRLFRFKQHFPEIGNEYRNTRKKYAYYLFKNLIKGNKECIKWHNEYLVRKISLKEYFLGILSENFLSYKVRRLFSNNKK